MADVFLSYARDDEAVARRVAKALGDSGFEVWWDAELPAHRAYSDVIERNLQDAQAVVVLWSATAAKSQWVRAEADFARNAGKLVQAQVDGTLPPMPFNQIQCADLKGWRGSAGHSGWSKLKSSVAALITGEEVREERPSSSSFWQRLRPHRAWAAAAVAILLVAAVAVTLFLQQADNRKPVLAVLPFRSLDAQDASLVAGIWEDTRTAIGRNPQLVVLGPNTAEALAEKGEAGIRKAADYLLEASVRTAGDRIRVSANLVRTQDGSQLWNQDFDRKLDDVFALQSEIASEIEGRIRGRLAEKGGVTPEHIATSGEVYALYSDARAKLRKRDQSLYPSAMAQLREVLRKDPNFAPAWATFAQILSLTVPSQRDYKPIDNAQTYARKAIELAPNLAEGHSALAIALALQGPVARAEIERAVELDPNDYQSLLWLGNMLNDAGDKRAAIDAYRKAVRIEPLFWPAVMNLLAALDFLHDEAGVQQLLAEEKRIGADHFAAAIEAGRAWEKGDLVRAANIEIDAYTKGGEDARGLISTDLWALLLQLGFMDDALKLGPVPEFAKALWQNDPKGLDMVESHGIDPKIFFSIPPLPQNAGRVYVLTGRSQRLAELYLSLHVTPGQFAKICDTETDAEGIYEPFLYTAPLVVVALRQSRHAKEADELLALAETTAKANLRNGKPVSSALLARVYALQNRKDEAIALLTAAANRNWVPEPPMLMLDLDVDPALSGLKADPRFRSIRNNILDRVARMQPQVHIEKLRQAMSA